MILNLVCTFADNIVEVTFDFDSSKANENNIIKQKAKKYNSC